MSAIFDKVKSVTAQELEISEEEIKPESTFADDLGADSLDIVELIMALEEEFNTEIPDDEAEKMNTVQDAVNYIEANAAKKP